MDLELDIIRPLRQEDMPRLAEPRGAPKQRLERLHQRHHAAAKSLAAGMPKWEVCATTGYSQVTLSILLADPTFTDLVKFYKDKIDAQYHDLHERLSGMAVDAADMLRDKLEAGELNASQLMEITKMGADRTGHGPSSTNIQVNVGLAARLEAARKRVKMIDVTPKEEKAA
jgi:hypothetical protein